MIFDLGIGATAVMVTSTFVVRVILFLGRAEGKSVRFITFDRGDFLRGEKTALPAVDIPARAII
jgi:hypothetical protein